MFFRAAHNVHLYFFTNAFFHVTAVNDREENRIQNSVQRPRNQKAKHNGAKLRAQRIDKLHPHNAEAEGKRNIGYAGKKRIPKRLKRMCQHVADRINKGKQNDKKHAIHSVVDCGL